MKKMAAFLMAFTLVCTSSPANLHTGAATKPFTRQRQLQSVPRPI